MVIITIHRLCAQPIENNIYPLKVVYIQYGPIHKFNRDMHNKDNHSSLYRPLDIYTFSNKKET